MTRFKMKRLRCLWFIGCFCLPFIVWAAPASTTPPLQLDPAQQQWLDEHRSLRVGWYCKPHMLSSTAGFSSFRGLMSS